MGSGREVRPGDRSWVWSWNPTVGLVVGPAAGPAVGLIVGLAVDPATGLVTGLVELSGITL